MNINRSNTILQYDQSFVVNGYQLSGVDNVQLEYNAPLQNNLVLGTDFGFNLNGPFQATLTMDRALIYQDPILQYTGNLPMNGSFLYNGKNYSFTSGFLNSYSVECSVGDIPKISCQISIYGDLKPSSESPTILPHPAIYIPTPRSISVSGDYTNTNRIKSFSYEIAVTRQPAYSIDNAKNVDDVIFISPVNIRASLAYDVYDFTPENYQDFIVSTEEKIFNIKILDRASNNILANYNVPNIKLVAQNLTSTSENTLTVTNQYLGYSI